MTEDTKTSESERLTDERARELARRVMDLPPSLKHIPKVGTEYLETEQSTVHW